MPAVTALGSGALLLEDGVGEQGLSHDLGSAVISVPVFVFHSVGTLTHRRLAQASCAHHPEAVHRGHRSFVPLTSLFSLTHCSFLFTWEVKELVCLLHSHRDHCSQCSLTISGEALSSNCSFLILIYS